MVVVVRSFYLFYFNNTKPRAHCARDSAHVVAKPIQPDPSNTYSINQTGNGVVFIFVDCRD